MWWQVLAAAQPDLVFYQSGVDGLSSDRLGKLCLTPQGLRRRDALVLAKCLSWRHSGPAGIRASNEEAGTAAGRTAAEGEAAEGAAGPDGGDCAELGPLLVVTMGGGYPTDLATASAPFQALVAAHADVFVAAARASASLQLAAP